MRKACTGPHYVDNQGFCHACGLPMDKGAWLVYCVGGYPNAEQETRYGAEFDAMLKKWVVDHSTR